MCEGILCTDRFQKPQILYMKLDHNLAYRHTKSKLSTFYNANRMVLFFCQRVSEFVKLCF